MCGSPSHPINDRHSSGTWPGTWPLRGSNLHVQHISSHFNVMTLLLTLLLLTLLLLTRLLIHLILLVPLLLSFSFSFLAFLLMLLPFKLIRFTKLSPLRVVCHRQVACGHFILPESERLVKICQNWKAGSSRGGLPVPKALLAKLLERLLPWI